MSLTEERQVELEEIPSKLNSNPLSMSRTDWWFSATMLLTGIILQNIFNSLAFLATLLLWLLLMRRRMNRRLYLEPAAKLRSFKYMRLRKGQVYPKPRRKFRRWKKAKAEPKPGVESQPESKPAKRFGRKKSSKPPRERTHWAIPFWVNAVPTPDGLGNTGVLHIPRRSSDTVIFSGSGSDLPSLDPMGQSRRYDQFAEMIQQAARQQRGIGVGVSMVFRKDPFDIFQLQRDQEDILHPQAVIPDAIYKSADELTDEDRAWAMVSETQYQLREDLAEIATQPRMLYCLTIRREGISNAARQSLSLERREVKRLRINRIARDTITMMEAAGISDPYALDKAELHRVVRGAHDVATIDEYYEALAKDPDKALDPRLHWPSTLAVGEGFSHSNKTYCGVLRITGQPGFMWHGFYRRLMVRIPARYYSIALVGETVRAKHEEFGLVRYMALLDRINEWFGTTRQSQGAQERMEKMEKRERELHASVYVQDYSILIAIRAPTLDSTEAELKAIAETVDEIQEELLEENQDSTPEDTEEETLDFLLEETENRLKGEGLSVSWIVEPSDQYDALWAATLGLPLL
jgi:hypothetical protein